ncbi:MAG TPA: PDZ domain-containing protein [Planctomycetota bacterium]|jgi:membrane-associated protease RseP (regulator of RpoE activity)|nr:PDZ domain-containing protein [Planctomycetota bacterium]
MQHGRRNVVVAATLLVGAGLAAVAVLRHRSADAPSAASRPLLRCEQVDPHHWRIPLASRDEYFRTPARLNEDIHLKPVVAADGKTVTSLTIAKLSSSGPMSLAGFKVGDRIVSLNGRPVDTLSRAMNLAHEAQSGARLSVQVERDGTPIDYRFDFE